MTTAGNNIAIMRSVPREHRSFALALATLGAHLFGDVPSPIVLGALEDSLAPKCVPEYDDDGGDGDFAIGPECASQRSKLRFTWLLCVLWLGWAVLGFGLAWLIVFRRHRGAREARDGRRPPRAARPAPGARRRRRRRRRRRTRQPIACHDSRNRAPGSDGGLRDRRDSTHLLGTAAAQSPSPYAVGQAPARARCAPIQSARRRLGGSCRARRPRPARSGRRPRATRRAPRRSRCRRPTTRRAWTCCSRAAPSPRQRGTSATLR